MQLAVVGCGRWGQNVIRTLHELEREENVRLTDVVHTGHPERADWVHHNTNARCHTDLDRALERCRAVCVVTPDETHPELVERCLNADRDVFVEKPLAFERETARELLERATQKDLLLMPGHLMVFHPFLSHLTDETTFRVDDLDEVLVERFNHLRQSGERRLLQSSLIHDLAVLDVVFTSAPESITVHDARGPFPPGRFLSAHLTYDPDVQVHVRACIDWPRKRRFLEFRRGNQLFAFNGLEDRLQIIDGAKDEPASQTKTFDTLPLTEELRHFVRAVRGEEPCRINRDHVMRVMETMDRIEDKASRVAGP